MAKTINGLSKEEVASSVIKAFSLIARDVSALKRANPTIPQDRRYACFVKNGGVFFMPTSFSDDPAEDEYIVTEYGTIVGYFPDTVSGFSKKAIDDTLVGFD